MLIDWFTVVAQALNFIVLVFLLKRFLFKPILAAIDAREQRIAAELAEADAKATEAREQKAAFQRKNDELDEHRDALMSQAKDAAADERARLRAEARVAADAESAKHRDALRRELEAQHETLARRTQEEVFAVARKVLTDIASTSLEASATAEFTRRIRTLDEPARATLGKALGSSSGLAVVRSAFDLPEEQRAAMKKALGDTFSTPVEVRFETAPDLVSGIELTAAGQKLAWNISDYLAALDKGVGELLDAAPSAVAESA